MTPDPHEPSGHSTVIDLDFMRHMGSSRLDRWVPEACRTDEEGMRLGRLVVGACLMVGVSSVGLAAARFGLDEPPSVVGAAVAGIAAWSFLVLALFRVVPRPRLAGTALACGGMVGTCTMAYLEGGLFSEGLYYALFVPLVTALFTGVRGAMGLAVLGTALFTSLLWMHLGGHDFGKGDASRTALLLHHMGLVGALWFGAYVGGLFEANRVRADRAQRATEAEAARLKDELIAVVTHELRTPVTAIKGGLGLLQSGLFGAFEGQASDLLDVSVRNTDRLGVLIDDLMDVQRLQRGRMEFHLQDVALAEELQQALRLNEGYAHRANVGIVLTEVPDVRVRVDSARLQQVLSNLLSNAIKFSPPEAQVNLEATLAEDRVRIRVVDTGPGIPEAARDVIFEPFRQVDASDHRSKAGSGLGLNIARGLTEGMGGRLDFDSVPGQGSVFYVDLPRAA